MRKQVIENLSQVAPPGEQFLACLHTETGPSPWLNILFEEIPFAMLIVQILRKYYFITLTNGHVVLNRASRLSNRPKEVVLAIPIQQAQFTGIKKGKIWSRLYFQFPGEAKPVRMNFHRIWNADVDRFIATFPHAVDGAQQGQYQAQVPQPAQQALAGQQYQGQYQGQAPQQQYAQQHQQYQGQSPQQYAPQPQHQQYPQQQGQQYPGRQNPGQGQYPPQQGQQYPGQNPYQR